MGSTNSVPDLLLISQLLTFPSPSLSATSSQVFSPDTAGRGSTTVPLDDEGKETKLNQ